MRLCQINSPTVDLGAVAFTNISDHLFRNVILAVASRDGESVGLRQR